MVKFFVLTAMSCSERNVKDLGNPVQLESTSGQKKQESICHKYRPAIRFIFNRQRSF
uniref:Uncharacterized protein n=1 Tax=Arundo donax TaxID=35708 RepID=A0A0A8YDZ1_ARUDO